MLPGVSVLRVENLLIEKYGEKAIHLFPYVDGYAFLFTENLTYNRNTCKTPGIFQTDILREEYLKNALEVLGIEFVIHIPNNQSELLGLAERVNAKIQGIYKDVYGDREVKRIENTYYNGPLIPSHAP